MQTQSPYWHQPEVTLLIADARTNPASRTKLVELVYRPVFRRLDAWLAAAGLKRLDIDADEIFADLWLRDLQKGIENAQFNDRAHFLRFVLLRCRQAATQSAHRVRERRARWTMDASASDSAGRFPTPPEVAEYAESINVILEKLEQLPHPKCDIVSLHFLEGLTIRQIATHLQLPSSTVHRQLQDALRDLRKEFR
jgi:RNA polymerase sigma factor (sigma-70 family)